VTYGSSGLVILIKQLCSESHNMTSVRRLFQMTDAAKKSERLAKSVVSLGHGLLYYNTCSYYNIGVHVSGQTVPVVVGGRAYQHFNHLKAHIYTRNNSLVNELTSYYSVKATNATTRETAIIDWSIF